MGKNWRDEHPRADKAIKRKVKRKVREQVRERVRDCEKCGPGNEGRKVRKRGRNQEQRGQGGQDRKVRPRRDKEAVIVRLKERVEITKQRLNRLQDRLVAICGRTPCYKSG